ncbi:MAG: electron transfer flavoprotein subunit alpha/FixB family protein [Deltaproteobacteria bacterium]|nr:electron transfer flavoprotein subunit alpha/FixB family protein [Deltaproteobacteria bacterium]
MNREPLNHSDIWALVQHREGAIEETSFGLIGEARRIVSQLGGEGTVTAICLGLGLEAELRRLGAYGTDRVLYLEGESLVRYQGELFAKELFELCKKHNPTCILAAQTAETSDLCARLAALLETALVTCAMDLSVDPSGKFHAIRPVSNGYLFEDILVQCASAPVISFLSAVLTAPEPDKTGEPAILTETVAIQSGDLETKVIRVIAADPENLDIEEADIIVSGGRGVGKGEAFDIIHDLARAIGGSVGATRPVIDWQTLPYERQIGQTGKTVTPRLIINCGISGANEYTAGMEKSQRVIAINTDPRARIFRFADLGIVGDVHTLLPLLIEQIKKMRETRETEAAQ